MQSADILLRDKAHSKAVGLNQTKKQILNGSAKMVYIASDADPVFAGQVTKLCEENNAQYDRSYSMAELGDACAIDVPCAVCALLL